MLDSRSIPYSNMAVGSSRADELWPLSGPRVSLHGRPPKRPRYQLDAESLASRLVVRRSFHETPPNHTRLVTKEIFRSSHGETLLISWS
jgi:hypothetical protein